jgi:hypothetical protein
MQRLSLPLLSALLLTACADPEPLVREQDRPTALPTCDDCAREEPAAEEPAAEEPATEEPPAEEPPAEEPPAEEPPAPQRVVAFVFDQDEDAVYRLADDNGDGDALDPGEVTRFYDDAADAITGTGNAQGLLALSANEVLVTDNTEPVNMVRLTDTDADGTAFGSGEASVFFSGGLPGGVAMTFPVNLTRGADGALYFYENTVLDADLPDGVYRLDDANGDGDVDDAGEVTLVATTAVVGEDHVSAFDVEILPDGFAYFLDTKEDDDIRRLYSVGDGGGATEVLAGDWLWQWTQADEELILSYGSWESTWLRSTGELLITAGRIGDRTQHIVALNPGLDGVVTAAIETRLLWDDAADDAPDTGTLNDLHALEDDRLIATDNLHDRVLLFTDIDGDGDYNDAGEVRAFYDADVAEAAGLPVFRQNRTVTAILAPLPGE